MRIITANEQALPEQPEPHVEADVTANLAAAGLIGWQEIHLDRYIKAIDRLGGHRFETFHPEYGGAAVSVAHRLGTIVEARTHQLHEAVAKVCLRRSIAEVDVRLRNGVLIRVLNLHMVASAWSGTKGDVRLRRQLWHTGLGNLIDRLDEANGLPAVILGDFNARTATVAAELGGRVGGRRIAYHAPARSIDQLITLDGKGHRWTGGHVETLPRHSDHAARRLTITLRARGGTR